MPLKIERKKIRLALLLIVSGFLLMRSGCVESVTDTGTSSSSSPTIEVSSPVTGDTVYVGTNQITYSATDPSGQGLSQFEVFINGVSANTYSVSATATSGSSTKVYLDIPQTLLYQNISYYVLAYSKSGKTKASKVQNNLYVVPTPPKAPGKLKISKVNDTKFNLTWIDSSDNENRFELWRKDGTAGTYKLIKTLGENVFYADDAVPSAYSIYFYKVRAGHATGVSAFSNEVNTLIAPSNLQARSTAANTVELNWTDNSAFEDGFRIERADGSNGDFAWIATVLTNITTYKDETVMTATNYRYRVSAFTGSAPSPYSNEVQITTPTADTPPTQLNADFNYTTRKVDITWNSANYNMTTYVERKAGYNGPYTQVAALNNILLRKYSDSLLTPAVKYTYRVREMNYAGLYTSYSNEDTAYVPILAPLAPSNLEIGKTTNPLVFTLFWQDNSSDEQGFKLYRKDGLYGQYQYVDTFDPNTHAATVYVQSSSTIYYFKLTSYKDNLESDFSNEVSTSDLGIWGLSVDYVTTNSVRIRWTDNFANEVSFSVERKIEGGTYQVLSNTVPPAINTGSTVFYTDSNNLLPGVKYYYRVRAVFAVGFSTYSNEISVTTNVL